MPGPSNVLSLHIGLHKTGTTFIQTALARNRKRLRDHGILYPAVETRTRTSFQHASLVRLLQAGDPNPLTELLEQSFRRSRHVLLSAERFSAAMARRPDCVAGWLDAMQSNGCTLRAIVYVRRQDLIAESSYRALVRNPQSEGLTDTFPEYVKRRAAHWDYWKLLAPWRKALEAENLLIRPFEKAQWLNGSLLDDFQAAMGVAGILESPRSQVAANRSFGALVTELLRRTNSRRDDRQQAEAAALLKVALPQEVLYDDSGPAYFSAAERRAFVERFADSNRRVAAEWLHRADGRLFLEEIKPDGRPRIELSDAAVAELQDMIRAGLARRPSRSRFSTADAVALGLLDRE